MMHLLHSLPPGERSAGGGAGEDGVADVRAARLWCVSDVMTHEPRVAFIYLLSLPTLFGVIVSFLDERKTEIATFTRNNPGKFEVEYRSWRN